jgi:phenylalanyl-tRNA synthetase alpha chain
MDILEEYSIDILKEEYSMDILLKELEIIYSQFKEEIKICRSQEDIKLLKSKFIGRKSRLSEIIGGIPKMSEKMKKSVGKKSTDIKKTIEKEIGLINFQKISVIDCSLPVEENIGSLHCLSVSYQRVKSILMSMGLNFMESPEIESEWRNFDCLNINEKHPARENHHSFFLEKGLLRTHTSSIQSYILEKYGKNDSKTFTIGRVFRNDHDSTHLPMFHQIECLVIEKSANLPALFSFIQSFLNCFFEREMIVRKRPSFFPFTNFSIEIDVWMGRWIEILGGGIIHHNVFKNCGVEPSQGFALGCGLERLHMLKNNTSDIRDLYSKDTRVLNFLGSASYI